MSTEDEGRWMTPMMRVRDPNNNFQGSPMPALTTMLHVVCDNNPRKFEEATRLIELFMDQAAKEVKRETGSNVQARHI